MNSFRFLTERSVETLLKAYDRYNILIFTHGRNDNSTDTVVDISLKSYSEAYPQIDTDESYSIMIPDSNDAIQIKAATVYGALRALESLSQLVYYDFDTQQYAITGTPITVQDAPRYQHRGMLLDTARHYQPISALKRTIDALSYAKYNVLHWHAVDTQVHMHAYIHT